MKKNKVLSAGLAACLCVSALVGCGEKDTSTSNTPGHEQTEYSVSEDLLNLDFFYMGASTVLDCTTPMFQEAERLTNVKLTNTLSQATSDAKQSFTIMMASKELPDIVAYYGREEYFAYGMDGAFVALNDMIDTQMPNFKKFLEERDDVRKFITAPDGNIYFIPFVPDGKTSKGWFVRQDWLDALNLETPTNVEEYYNMLVQFRDGDPNGNGEQDEVPYFNRNMGTNYEEGISDLYSFWGAHKEFYADEDGKVHFGAIEPEFKEAIINIQKWYQEKLIDTEIYTRGGKARDYMLGNNLGGSTHDWFTSNSTYNTSLKDKIPGFQFVSIAPPSGVEYSSRQLIPIGWAMTSQNEHPEETIKFFDFWWTEKGRNLANFGIEGEHWNMVDGEPTFTPELLEKIKSDNSILFKEYGIQSQIGFQQDFRYEEQWADPAALEGMQSYIDNNYIEEPYPPVAFTPEEQKRYSELLTAINTHRDERTQQWILNGSDVEAEFDDYLEKMKALGVEELIELQQTAYDRYMEA